MKKLGDYIYESEVRGCSMGMQYAFKNRSKILISKRNLEMLTSSRSPLTVREIVMSAFPLLDNDYEREVVKKCPAWEGHGECTCDKRGRAWLLKKLTPRKSRARIR